MPTQTPWNNMILPIKKLHYDDYWLVHDLQTINNTVLAETPKTPNQDLVHLQLKSTLLQYVDRLLCSHTQEQCIEESITLGWVIES